MVDHVNFYENVTEANARLKSTVVLYDSDPHYILAITGHKADGVFRVYMKPLSVVNNTPAPGPLHDYAAGTSQLGEALDNYIDDPANAGSGLIRKSMNSSYFNKFRPFPLGMCNVGTRTLYLERQPMRPKMEQGLTRSMVYETQVSTAAYTGEASPSRYLDLFSEDFEACIRGRHPSAAECIKELLDPKVKNEAHAFHRFFAIARGPVGMLFLAYKGDIIGVLPRNNLAEVGIGKDFWHIRESVAELGIFGAINKHP